MHGRSKAPRVASNTNNNGSTTKSTQKVPKSKQKKIKKSTIPHPTSGALLHTKQITRTTTANTTETSTNGTSLRNNNINLSHINILTKPPLTQQHSGLKTTAIDIIKSISKQNTNQHEKSLIVLNSLQKNGLFGGQLSNIRRRNFSTTSHPGSIGQDDQDNQNQFDEEQAPSLGPQQTPFQDRTIALKDIKREYLLQRPEIALRAKFARIPTREDVTGLNPDHGRDTVKFEHPGNKKFREDHFLQIRDETQIKFISPEATKKTLRIALNTSESKLTESLLSLAVAEPIAYRPNTDLMTAETNIEAQLQIAPNWDVDDPQKEQLKQFFQVKSSEKIFRGDLTHASKYLTKRIEEAENETLPYFKPTGNVQLDEMNRRNLAKGILPIPNFAGDNNSELTPDDITQIDEMAQSLARHVEVTTSAKQPYDTASKIVKKRLQSLPNDPNDFFIAAGFPTLQSRNILAYSRYLKLVSVNGTVKQALDIWDEIRTRGFTPSNGLILSMISTMGLTNATKEDEERMMKEMMLNKVNPDKIANYTQVSEWIPNIVMLPKSKNRPHGAPEGFISAAPQPANYGAPFIRGKFTVAVEYAFYLLEKAKENDIVPNRSLATTVIQVCGMHQQYERAFAVYEEFKRYAEGQHIDPKLAVSKKEIALAKPHRDAKLEGYTVDQSMAVALMKSCWKSGQARLVEETFHRLWEQGLQPNAPMYNQVILSCVKGGYVEKAFKYFEQLQHFGHTPSIVTYSSLIRACSAPDRPEFYPRAFEVFHECISAGFRPDEQLFNDLLLTTVEQSDLHNMISIFRLMTRDFPHLINMQTYINMALGLGKSMGNEKLPGFGGYVLTRTGRTLFGQTFTGDKQADADLTGTKKIKLTREDRLAMIDALYSEVALRTESHDRTGTQGGRQFAITTEFLDVIVAAYANAATGILKWDRHERKEGREDPLLRLTPTHINQLIERTWGKVVTLQKQHQHVFKLSSGTYKALFEMYGAADRLDDAVYHLLYLTRGLKMHVTKQSYVELLDWCEKNAHHGPGLVIIDEMKRNNIPIQLKYENFFKKKERQMATPLVPNTFPSMKPHAEDREAQWQQPKRDKRTGKMINHPMDWDGSYKDF